MKTKDLWEVDVWGKPNDSFAISITTNASFYSPERMSKERIYISSSGGPCHFTVCEFVFNKLIEVAQELCDKLNRGEYVEWRDYTGYPMHSSGEKPI